MKIDIDKIKGALFAFFSIPYLIGAFIAGSGASRLRSFGSLSEAGLLAVLALVLGLTGIGGIFAAWSRSKTPDYLVALHAGIAVLFIVISSQG